MKAIKKYIEELKKIKSTDIDTEISYYHAFQTLIEEMGGKDVQVVCDAKKQVAGKPDFTILAKNKDTIGYIEAKTIGTDLESKAKIPQIKKYIDAFPNFIFTNYYEFRLYHKGTLVSQMSLYDNGLLKDITENGYVDFTKLINRFLSKTIPVETEVKIIAELLADVTRDTRDAIKEQLKSEIATESGELYGAYKDFQVNLLHDLTEKQFVDMYAQTITYGLLTAKMYHDDDENTAFDRNNALFDVPKSFGVLHAIFKFIATDDLSDEIEAAIDEIITILIQTNPGRVLRRYYDEHLGRDWFMHFYETFLNEYDPEERKNRGVYYTPPAVVAYITRSVNRVLKEEFDKKLGFGDTGVRVLDPAAGTLSFITSACQLGIDEELKDKIGDGMIDGFIKNHILKRFYGFELMMTPYVLGHLKMKTLLDENKYPVTAERINLFLTNTLDTSSGVQSHLTPIGVALEKEAVCVSKVRAKTPILAIIGNPPYSGSSANKGLFDDELKIYKTPVKGERNIKSLSDDYVKFIRFAHKKLDEQEEGGIVGFITNNSYLEGVIHRGMRKSLMDSFDEIYVLNLHGNARTEKKTPTGGKDENIFGIKPGVAITFFIKYGKKHTGTKVHYRDVWGTIEEKFDYLNGTDRDDFAVDACLGVQDIGTTVWTDVNPCEPDYFFDDRDFSLRPKYDLGVSTSDIFKERTSGITTGRDDLTIQKTRVGIIEVVKKFAALSVGDARIEFDLKKDSKAWTVEKAQKDIKDHVFSEEYVKPVLYRPFDTRYTYYTSDDGGFMTRSREEIMQHMLTTKENMGLFTCRNGRLDGADNTWNSVFCTCDMGDYHIFYRSGGILQPLYLYSKFGEKRPNINNNIFVGLENSYGAVSTPEDIFYYIYGILHSNKYREKYVEFLKIDFPKIPFTEDHDLFLKIGVIGKQLTDLHLMKPDVFNTSSIKYHGRGDHKVEKIGYDEEKHRVVINKKQYFEPVSEEVWEYQIGGYTVMQKWLKDRRHDILTMDDINHYRYIGEALGKTIELQDEIDELYGKVEDGEIINLSKEYVEITDYSNQNVT